MSTVLSSVDTCARKAHTCTSCGRKIRPGETYLVERRAEGGTIRVDKTCIDCRGDLK